MGFINSRLNNLLFLLCKYPLVPIKIMIVLFAIWNYM